VTYSVPAFEVGFDLSGHFLSTPLPAPVPMNNYVGYQHPASMDMNTYDPRVSREISRWMEGLVGDGEEGIISRNDALFNVYKYIAKLGKFSRNKHEDSTVLTTRADRTDKYEGVSLVIIEEKPRDLRAAVGDIARKFRWLPHYSRLPFIFGIAVTPDELEIYTLHENNSMVRVFDANLDDPVERWKCVVAAINIARTLKMFVEQRLVITSIAFDTWHERNNKRIRLDLNFVEVEFKEDRTFNRMRLFYEATKNVPHLEHPFIHPTLGAFNEEKNRIRLVPVGVDRMPNSEEQLITAIKHICECLYSLHKLGYYHCDVRWSNIIEYFGEWYLIDSEYACSKNEHELRAIRSSTTIKSQYVLDTSKPWSQFFDLYQVGKLLVDSNIIISNKNLVALRNLLLSKKFSLVAVKNALEAL
jgi:tRNA A-37 threonylcarbamoyl transferase component Bud32